MRYVVEIPGSPVPQGRVKAARWVAKDGRSGVAVRDPSRSRNWKGMAREAMRAALEKAGVNRLPAIPEGAVEMGVFAIYPCPKGDHRKRNPPGWRWHTKRGDLDNIIKAVKDAGTGVLWADDAQVACLSAVKLIAPQGRAPCVRLVFRSVDERLLGYLEKTLSEVGL